MIQLIKIDEKYVKLLKQLDYRVQSNFSSDKKETKPFLGVLFSVDDNIEYFVPLSSPKPKHEKMNNSADFHKIFDKNGKLISVLNFNNMIPVNKNLYKRINIPQDPNKYVLQSEYVFCDKNEDVLKQKAIKLYNRFKEGKLTEKETDRTCNFTLLENELMKYLNKN